MRYFYVLPAIAVFISLSSPAWSQATVNESLETKTLYVDASKGSDSNPGTSSQPLKTISAAASKAMSNKAASLGTKVIVNPGTYREAISLIASHSDSSLPITFQAATTGTVKISGAVQETGWALEKGNSNIYTAKWSNRWGFCAVDGGNAPFEQQIVLRREMIFVNGTPMTQVLAQSSVKEPGTFYVDENAGLVYVWPPSGTNMSTADVEVATLPTLLTLQGPTGHALNGVVFRGLTFEYANSCHGDAAVTVIGTSTNIIFDTDTFQWNNGQGLSFANPASDITVENSTANHNGAAGMKGYKLLNTLWTNDVANYNNWRGALGAYYEWNTAGFHIFSDHTETMTSLTANYNQTHSIHWDTDASNITLTSFASVGNMLGPLYEKSEGPLTISNSHFCNSLSTAAGYAGFILRMSESATLTNNTFYNNNVAQILVTGDVGGASVTNWQTGQVYQLVTSKITLSNNTLEAVGTAQDTIKDGFLGGSDWTSFITTLKATSNTYWNAATNSAFVVPVPKSGTVNTFSQWQNNTTEDYTSKFAVPATNPATVCAATADGPDYWLIVDAGTHKVSKTGSVVFNLSTVALGGMTGTVKLSTDGISQISGASVTLSPASISTAGTSVLTFNTNKTPAGTYNFPVLANTGSSTKVVYLSVTVQ